MEDLINEPVPVNKAKSIRSKFLKDLPSKGEAFIKVTNPKKTKGLIIRSYTDRPFLLPDGKQRRYVLDKSIRLNLENEEDRLLYGQLINHPIHANSGIYSVENKEAEAEMTLKHKEMEAEANSIIFKMKDNDVVDFARILLIPGVGKSSPQVLKREMLIKAEEDPKKFIEEWNHSDKPFKIVLRQCLDLEICVKHNGAFLLNNTGIGTTFEQGVEWLKGNESIMPDLRKQIVDKMK